MFRGVQFNKLNKLLFYRLYIIVFLFTQTMKLLIKRHTSLTVCIIMFTTITAILILNKVICALEFHVHIPLNKLKFNNQ